MKALIEPILLYGCEASAFTLRQERALRATLSSILRYALRVKRKADMSFTMHTEELHKDMLLAPTAIVERKLTALGHWVRLLSHEFSLPCLSLAAWNPRAKRRRGGQPTTFSSCVCKQLHIDRLGDVGDMCLNRERWRLVEQCCVEKEQQHLVDVAKHRGLTDYSEIAKVAKERVSAHFARRYRKKERSSAAVI